MKDAGPIIAHPAAKPGRIREMELDGHRMQVAVRRGRATWFSRNGHDESGPLPDFADAMAGLPDCVLDGEACGLRPDGRTASSALRSAIGREADALVGDLRFVFDCLRHEDENRTS